MSRVFSIIVGALLAMTTAVAAVSARPAAGAPHRIVVRLIDKPNARFAFDPSVITVQHGDTVHFVQASSAPHNVSFRAVPKGAKLGAAATGPYLANRGDVYDLVMDGRFTDGTYKFACDPHEAIGMSGTLIVQPAGP